MPLYTFFLGRLDGPAHAFEAHELADDAGAVALSAALLADHASAEQVSVYDGDRMVLPAPPAAERSQPGRGADGCE